MAKPRREGSGAVDPVPNWLDSHPGRVGADWRPAADVTEYPDHLLVRMELAGVRREDIQVTLDGDLLQVRGVRRPPAESGGRPHQLEIATGPFERRVRLGQTPDGDAVRARLENGVLTITLPCRDSAGTRIPVDGT